MTHPQVWRREFGRWVAPFVRALRHSHQRRWAPVYLEGLLGDGDRKSVEPMAARVCPGDVQQLHHFVSASPWPVAPLEAVLAQEADRLVGGPDAVLVIDDTPLRKQGRHSVGVGPMYCGDIQAQANAQSVVTVTLARGDVPVVVGLKLYLPRDWAGDAERRRGCGVPSDVAFRERPAIALAEVDRLRALGVRFGCVCADGGYGKSGDFRRALTARGLTWAVTITMRQRAYPADVTFVPPAPGRKHPQPRRGGATVRPLAAPAVIAALGPDAFRRVAWRDGTRGPLAGDFAMCRVRLVTPPPGSGWNSAGKTPQAEPDAVWLVCQRLRDERTRRGRTAGGVEYRYYATNQPAAATPEDVVRALRARWSCEQAHQQLKGELGLGHYEGRGWRGLHHHLLLTAIAYAFLQHLRLAHPAAAPSPELSDKAPPNAAPPRAAGRGGKIGAGGRRAGVAGATRRHTCWRRHTADGPAPALPRAARRPDGPGRAPRAGRRAPRTAAVRRAVPGVSRPGAPAMTGRAAEAYRREA